MTCTAYNNYSPQNIHPFGLFGMALGVPFLSQMVRHNTTLAAGVKILMIHHLTSGSFLILSWHWRTESPLACWQTPRFLCLQIMSQLKAASTRAIRQAALYLTLFYILEGWKCLVPCASIWFMWLGVE